MDTGSLGIGGAGGAPGGGGGGGGGNTGTSPATQHHGLMPWAIPGAGKGMEGEDFLLDELMQSDLGSTTTRNGANNAGGSVLSVGGGGRGPAARNGGDGGDGSLTGERGGHRGGANPMGLMPTGARGGGGDQSLQDDVFLQAWADESSTAGASAGSLTAAAAAALAGAASGGHTAAAAAAAAVSSSVRSQRQSARVAGGNLRRMSSSDLSSMAAEAAQQLGQQGPGSVGEGVATYMRAQEKELREAAAAEVARENRERRGSDLGSGGSGQGLGGDGASVSDRSGGGKGGGQQAVEGNPSAAAAFLSAAAGGGGGGGSGAGGGGGRRERGGRGSGGGGGQGQGLEEGSWGDGGGGGGGGGGKGRGRKRSLLTAEERAAQSRYRNREHARNTRLRKKAYTKKLKELVEDLERQRREESLVNEAQRSLAMEGMYQRKQAVQAFLHFRATDERDRGKWASVLDESFVLTLPITPYRFFHRVEVSNSLRVVRGIDAVMADSGSLRLMVEAVRWSSLAAAAGVPEAGGIGGQPQGQGQGQGQGQAASQPPMQQQQQQHQLQPPGNSSGNITAPVSMHFEVDPDDIIMNGDTLMCRWTLRTENTCPSSYAAHASLSNRPLQPLAPSQQPPTMVATAGSSAPSQKRSGGRRGTNGTGGSGSGGPSGTGMSSGGTGTGTSGGGTSSWGGSRESGGESELNVEGMLYARFAPGGKLGSVEMAFDVMTVMQQLQRAAGVPCDGLIVPNSLEAACQRSTTARVLVKAEPPYPVLHVSERWTALRGQTQADMEGRPLDLLEGSTLAPGTSYLLREVTAGRPTSCIMLMFQHCRQSFTGYLQLFPLYASSTPSTTANPSSRSGGGAIAGLQMPLTQTFSSGSSPPSQQQRPTRPAHILGILREVPNFSYDVRQALQLQETAAQPQLQPPLPPPSPQQQQPQPGFGYAAYHPPAVMNHQQHEQLQQQQGQGGQY